MASMGRIVDSGDITNEVEMKYHYTKYGVKLNIQENFNHVAAIHFDDSANLAKYFVSS